MLKDRMDDASRFARFLRREAADYHDPPEPPVEVMWAGIEARLGAPPVSDSPEAAGMAGMAGMADAVDCVGDAVDRPLDVLGYHEPPPAPREAMWERIEAEWVARQPEAPGEREATRGPLRLVVARTLGRRPGRTAAWLTGAAAASVALAVALDGDPQLPVPAETVAAAAPAPTPVGAAGSAAPSIAATDSGPLAPTAAEEALALSVVEEPLETNRQFAAAVPPPAADPSTAAVRPEADLPVRVAVSSPAQRPAGAAGRASADEYDMAGHLDRARTLLVAFRTDIGTDESQEDLARWARELVVETRSRLATPAADGQQARTLLQDLELILVQIARLGPDAPDFERELARESMERQGTLMRLRSVSGT
ncbi:hypothetical protein [Candidatus Palauibacter sp.]|uniref:hypothetical protein n=1 Tax=Candidatus Palauibacter sp. TaxID=3101350 RepID=UPI003B01B340